MKDKGVPMAVILAYGEERFPDVLKKLAELSEAGYRFQLKTKDKESDLCICLNPKSGDEFDAELFEHIVKECADSIGGRR